jgi:hypothetical protein
MRQFDPRKVNAVNVCFFGQALLRPALFSLSAAECVGRVAWLPAGVAVGYGVFATP